MKYFVMILIFSVSVMLPAYAQYIGNQSTGHITIDANNKQYDITYRIGEQQKITALKYDAEAQSMLFYISTDDEFIIQMELQVSPQTFTDLLTRGPDCAPEETFLLANGMELDYKILKGDSIIWKFDVPPKTTVIELIGSSPTGQGQFPQIKGIERTYQIDPGQQITLAGNFLDSCGAPIKNGTITLSTTGLPMPRAEQTMSDDEGRFEFKITSHDLEGINIVKGVLYGETEYTITPYYDIDFLIPIASLKQQIENGVQPENLVCREELVLLFKYNWNPACVKPETERKLIQRGWGIPSMIEVKNAYMWIRYQFNNGEILSAKAFGTPNEGPGIIPSVSLIISLNALQDSNLNINLPRGLIDSKVGEAADNVFVVVDGQELEVTHTITTTNRILTIPIHQGEHQLEIIGYGYYKEGLPLPPVS